MAEERKELREFLIVQLPEQAEVGSTLRLLGLAGSQAAADKEVASLDPGMLGRVAVLERKALYVRRAAVETLEISEAIGKK